MRPSTSRTRPHRARAPHSPRPGEIAINRADKRLIFKNVDGTLGYGSILNARPSGRKAVELGDGSDLSVKPSSATVFGTLADLFSRVAYPELWGAAGDGNADDSSALLAAGNSFSGRCGVVQLAPSKRYRVGTSFRLPKCTTLRGVNTMPDDPAGHQTSLFDSVGGLALDNDATITLNSSAGIENTLIVQSGLTLPAPDSAAFAGTAIACAAGTILDATTRSNGPFIRNVTVIGFNRALTCQNADRPRVEQFEFDSINGIYSNGSFDTSIFNRTRGWPYASVGFTGWAATGASGTGTTATVTLTPASKMRVGTQLTVAGMGPYNGSFIVTASSTGSVSFASTATGSAAGGTVTNTDHTLSRSGTAFDFDGQQDDTHITNALAFGYNISYNFRAAGNVLGDMLWSDQVTRPPFGSVGFRFGNTIGRTSFGQIYANGSTYGVQNANTGGLYGGVDIAQLFVQTLAPGAECINYAAGTTGYINIGNINGAGCTTWLADIAAAPNAYLRIGGGTAFNMQGGSTAAPVIAVPVTGALRSNIVINDRNLRTDLSAGASLFGNGQLGDFTIASAATIRPPASGVDVVALSGTTTVTTIQGTFGGRELVFNCTAVCGFAKGGNIALNGGAAFIGSAGAQIKFRLDANNSPVVWREQWRSKPVTRIFATLALLCALASTSAGRWRPR